MVGLVGLIPVSSITEQMRLEDFNQLGTSFIMQPNGDIITSSAFYENSVSNNYLRFLEEADLKGNYTQENIRTGIKEGVRQLFRLSVDGEGYYALIQPLNDEYHSGWYLVVQLSDKITTNQVNQLLLQSLVFFVLAGIGCLAVAVFIYRKMNEVKTLRIVEQTKTSFLANMSHEIRTPLNGISGLCYLMQKNLEDKEKLSEYLQRTLTSTTFLQDIINDVLDMSKIESGQIELIYEDVNLGTLLSEVKTLLETQALNKQIDFTVQAQGLGENWIKCDPVRIKQVLMNILGNAIKFTPEGGKVTLTVTQTIESEKAKTMFLIADNGCGMSPEFLKRIWNPFEQENRKVYQNGTGLGTTISKNLVEKMQGSISVESKPDQGTVFNITIPFVLSKEPISAKKRTLRETTVNLKGKRILVAEDNELNRMIITTVLSEQGCILIEAVNGKEAVDIFKTSPAHYFDLILMDIQMPVMDGCEATRLIRQSSHPDAKTILIFAVTANAFQEDLNTALAAGMNDSVTKPLDMAKLLQKIGQVQSGGETI